MYMYILYMHHTMYHEVVEEFTAPGTKVAPFP